MGRGGGRVGFAGLLLCRWLSDTPRGGHRGRFGSGGPDSVEIELKLRPRGSQQSKHVPRESGAIHRRTRKGVEMPPLAPEMATFVHRDLKYDPFRVCKVKIAPGVER